MNPEISAGIAPATNTWKTAGGGGAIALDDLSDVEITTPTDGQVLVVDKYGVWHNETVPGGGATYELVDSAGNNPDDFLGKYPGTTIYVKGSSKYEFFGHGGEIATIDHMDARCNFRKLNGRIYILSTATPGPM